jgi:hypothetical protein
MKNYFTFFLFLTVSLCNAQSSIVGNSITIGKLQIAEKDFPTPMDWHRAKKACASLGKGWRLPSKSELNFIYQVKPNIGLETYWSANESSSTNAWSQWMGNGGQRDYFKGEGLYVRAVRSVPDVSKLAPFKYGGFVVYEKNGHGLVVALMDLGPFDWDEAVRICEQLEWNGYNDWRLPTKDELNLVYKKLKKNKVGGFANAYYWSSTESGYDGYAWEQDFSTGRQGFNPGYRPYNCYVRAVRSF